MAICNRDAQPGVVIHSDRGPSNTPHGRSPAESGASGLVPSVGSIGGCYDNAMIESFWGRMQTGLLNRQHWKTRLELANAIFEYLETFHNRRRRHSALGMLTLIEYELRNNQIKPVA
jgi:putative transposase